MIAINQLTVDFGGFKLFENISYNIDAKDRIGLAGKNGAGKSTMLKIIAGLQQPTSGTVSIPKGYKIGYLPQHMLHNDTRTVFEEAEQAMVEIKELQARVDEMNAELAQRTDYESDSYMNFLSELTEKTERLSMMGGDNYKAEIEVTLKGLGFERSDFDRKTSEFSGGWRMRIELAKILLARPDIFLLDEPTNHLDIESIQWLEDFLKSYSGAVVVVSHDRVFLDNVTNRTIEIVLGKIYDYKANYSKYLILRQERFEQQMSAYKNQQKMIEDTEKFIERFRYKATKSVQVQSRIKQLEKIERIEVDDFDTSALHIKFPPAPHSGVISVKGKHVTKAFGDHVVLKDVEFEVPRGEKVAFVGRNGEGKTTMARMIMHEIPFDGEIVLGHGIKIGYFAQNQADLLFPDDTVFDTIDRVAVGDIRTKIRDLLGAFMFSGEDVDKKVAVLSGGEKTRLAMVRLLLEPVNLLVLDEPTNHLDIRSKELLKKAIKEFDGTAIIVSHDREFLDGLVSRVYEFRNQKMKEHIGGIYDFLNDRKLENLRELEQRKAPQKTASAAPQNIEAKSADDNKNGKLTYEQQKELSRRKNKAEKAVKETEQLIEKLEAEIAEMEEKMSADSSEAMKLLSRYDAAKRELDDAMAKWEKQSEELSKL
ncbi:MAG: ABC-F family ATP-binding cassette domain-containing protein [Bacteroidales bacterium]|jgi:ATP-binding cassette subfamily F protein 3|nr:ABC-F family ATP-binding cassette domain-containing protein [Bacteroidales bacterium]